MKSLWKILRLAKPYKGKAVLGVIFNILSVIFSLISFTFFIPVLDILFNQTHKVLHPPAAIDWSHPWTISKSAIADNFYFFVGTLIEKNGSLNALFYISMAILVLFFIKNLFRYLGMFYIDALRIGVIKDLRNSIFHKILILPLSFFTEQRKGDIIARSTNDIQEIEWSIASSLEMLFRDPLSIVLSFVFLFMMSPQLTLFVLILFPPSGILIAKIGNSLRKTSVKQQAKMGDILSMLEETLGGLKIIKAFNAIRLTNDNFRRRNEEYSRLTLSMYRKRDLASPISEFLGAVIMVAVLLYAGRLVLAPDHGLSGSVFIMYLVVFSQMIPPVKSLTRAVYNVQKGAASVERIEKILNAPEIIEEKEDAIPIDELKDRIELKNVSFQYEQKPILSDINFTVFKGKSVALVGPSGGGKSTIANLLPRFYDCQQGDILIDGISIRDYTISGVRNLFGIVTQEPILFNDTIYNNILFGYEKAGKAEVIEAAKIAHAHDFILQTEKGYDTVVGDRGAKLSGGQRQRISIARAVLRKPSVFIFDEATSSLDTKSERMVQAALEGLLSSHTSIVIAHRLSTIKNVDTILVLEKGKIVEQGTHDELLRKEGLYHKLYNMQYFDE